MTLQFPSLPVLVNSTLPSGQIFMETQEGVKKKKQECHKTEIFEEFII